MAEIQTKLFNEPETPDEIKTYRTRRRLLKKFAPAASVLPIIVYPGGWEVPEQLRKHIVAMRLVQLAEDPDRFLKYAVDAEAVAYLMTAALCFPFDHGWAQIYLHVTGKYMTEIGLKQLPDFISDAKLNEYEKRHLLKPLKRWIRQKQFKHIEEKKRDAGNQSIKSNDQTASGPPVLCDSTYAAGH